MIAVATNTYTKTVSPDFYKGKRILITGHTGFKGTWLCHMLHALGADVTGYSLEPPTDPSLYELSCTDSIVNSVIGDIRDLAHLKRIFDETRPEIVIHMAAQPIVRESYKDPVGTYEINVMGTVNVLECVRMSKSVKSVVNVTTDKVYQNREWVWGYRENEVLDGYDPYANSKSCSELVTASYIRSFFSDDNARRVSISTMRAGNVIGGGDFSKDRIIPDCVRAIYTGKELVIRNPESIRPYEFVLEPLYCYLLIAQAQYENPEYAGHYNVGPDEDDCVRTKDLVKSMADKWNELNTDHNLLWRIESDEGPHESLLLKLDCSKIKSVFGWKTCWDIEKTLDAINEWTNRWIVGDGTNEVIKHQIELYLSDKGVV